MVIVLFRVFCIFFFYVFKTKARTTEAQREVTQSGSHKVTEPGVGLKPGLLRPPLR